MKIRQAMTLAVAGAVNYALFVIWVSYAVAPQMAPLMRPVLTPQTSYMNHPPCARTYPRSVEMAQGYMGGGETGLTFAVWARAEIHDTVHMPFVMASCTHDAARSTAAGGTGLTNLVNGTMEMETLTLSGGTWASECLPSNYAVPDTLADSQWQYGCYSINVSSDTPLTLNVADTEIYVPATNLLVRNVQGSSHSRWVSITAESSSANIRFGIAENPLHQFWGAQSDVTDGSGYPLADYTNGGLDSVWRMAVYRARIELIDGAYKGIAQMDMYTPAGKCPNTRCTTQALWQAGTPYPRGTFEKDAMVRMSIAQLSNISNTVLYSSMNKLWGGWLTDAQVEHVRDLDVLEMQRHGAEFPELAEDYRRLKLVPSSTYETQSVDDCGMTNGCEFAYVGTRRVTSRAAVADVINGVNYKGPFGPADYTYSCDGATVSNNVVTFPGSGTYTVRATDPAGTFITNTIAASNPTTNTVTRLRYDGFADHSYADTFNSPVRDWVQSATNDGATYNYNGTEYRKWHARRLYSVPSSCGRWQGHCAKHAISPHVLATARHYGFWPAYEMTFTDAQGNTATVNPSGIVAASDWALSHGFTQAQVTAADVGDLMLMTVSSGQAIPDGCCPYLMTAETWRQVVKGPFGTLGWCATQTDLGWGLPVLFRPDISTSGGGYGSKWTWAAGFPFPSETSADWLGANGLMPKSLFDGLDVPTKFAPTYGGDSGLPLFLEDGEGRMILISNFHTVSSGTCYPLAFEIVRAYAASVGDTIKEWRAE